MLKSLAVALLFVSVANASEITVLDVSAKQLKSSRAIQTSFQVNVGNGNSGVAITTTRRMSGRDNGTISRTKTVEVAELKLEGQNLVAYTDSGSVVCGTLGRTPIFNRTALNLTGDCTIEVRKENKNVKVVIVTK